MSRTARMLPSRAKLHHPAVAHLALRRAGEIAHQLLRACPWSSARRCRSALPVISIVPPVRQRTAASSGSPRMVRCAASASLPGCASSSQRERHAAHARLRHVEARAPRLERQDAVERLDPVARALHEAGAHLDAPADRQRPELRGVRAGFGAAGSGGGSSRSSIDAGRLEPRLDHRALLGAPPPPAQLEHLVLHAEARARRRARPSASEASSARSISTLRPASQLRSSASMRRSPSRDRARRLRAIEGEAHLALHGAGVGGQRLAQHRRDACRRAACRRRLASIRSPASVALNTRIAARILDRDAAQLQALGPPRQHHAERRTAARSRRARRPRARRSAPTRGAAP